jgi:hypothetical protein
MILLYIYLISYILLAVYVYFYEDNINLKDLILCAVTAPAILMYTFMALIIDKTGDIVFKLLSKVDLERLVWRKK